MTVEGVAVAAVERSDRELLDETVRLRWQIERLEAELLERVAEIDRRRSYEKDGAVTSVGWLRDQCRLDRSRANQLVRLARAGDSFPELREAHLHARISSCEARRIVQGADLLRRDLERRGTSEKPVDEDVAELRQNLLDSAENGVGPDGLRREIDSQRHELAADSMAFDEWVAFQQRELHFYTTFDGMVDVRGTLDPTSAVTVRTAIESLNKLSGNQNETAGQRRADALVQLAAHAMDAGTLPTSRGQRPHVSVTVSEQTLSRATSVQGAAPAELHGHGPSSGDSARMFACDAEITRLVTGPASEVLDIGRETRVVPAALRRAIAFRDGGCAHPRCDRPVEWCDAHHITHWAHGGATALDNLVLLCRRHHSEVHLKGAKIEWNEGEFSFSTSRRPQSPPAERDILPPCGDSGPAEPD